jgi:hypothetical protein
MNKSKKELYEENKKLRKTLKTYGEFWETDAIEECTKQMKFTKKTIYAISIALLIISAFLLGLSM